MFASSYRTLWCVAAAVTGNRSKAGDVVQEAAVVALGKVQEFDPSTNFTAWMGQIVRYVALNEGRKGQRERAGRERLAAEGEVGYTPDEMPSFDPRIEAALGELDETARACLLLRTVMDLGYKEIAAALGVPEGTAMSHVFRARKVLRDRLRDLDPAGAEGGSA